jgi:hypothetical protein
MAASQKEEETFFLSAVCFCRYLAVVRHARDKKSRGASAALQACHGSHQLLGNPCVCVGHCCSACVRSRAGRLCILASDSRLPSRQGRPERNAGAEPSAGSARQGGKNKKNTHQEKKTSKGNGESSAPRTGLWLTCSVVHGLQHHHKTPFASLFKFSKEQ